MRKGALAGLVALVPGVALAECTGGGCYEGLVWFLGGIAVLALGLFATVIVLLLKRKFRAALIIVGVCLALSLLLF